MKMTNNFFVLF